jgi:hypothetical protein
MQDYWLSFAKDPINGLPTKGWHGYSGSQNGSSALFGWRGDAVQSLADSELESACDEGIPNGKPKPPTN